MVLTIGAILLFGTFLSSSNRLMTGNTQIASQNEYNISALAIAQSVIDEAKTKAFDQKTVVSAVAVPTSLTAVDSLGKDGGSEAVPNPDTLTSTGYKSMTKFNDVDDYKGYNRLVNTPRAEGYKISIAVGYATEIYPDSSKNVQTFCKKMTVTVTSSYITQPIALSYAFLY